jgi:DNA-binding SARP family transcriptional activator/DNA-binding CsgD family transcriptional regulator
MEIRLLGSLEASVDGRAIALGAAKQRAVLAMLALRPNAPVSVDRFVEGLWGEQPPPSAPKMVQLYVSQLRKLLDGEKAEILTRGRGYELRLAADSVDAVRFERLVADAAQAERTVNGAARQALALWHGPPLDDLADEPFAAAEIRRLEELWLRARELAIDEALAAAEHAVVIGELEDLVAEQPLRERLHAQRMLALYRCGRQADALGAYRHARNVLVEQVGVEPGSELRDLHEAMLRQDPSLELPTDQDRAPRAEETFVTILFTDLVGSTSLFQRDGDEAAEVVLREHFAAQRRAVAEHGGREVKSTGDGLTVAFSSVVAAVRCAVDMQRAMANAPGKLALRVGLDAGEPLADGEDLYGTPVIVASRLCNAAAAGQILATEVVRHIAGPRVAELMSPAGERRLRVITRPVAVAEIRWQEPTRKSLAAHVRKRRGATDAGAVPLVEREEELAILEALLASARSGLGSVLLVEGPAGIGKTSLLAAARELAAESGMSVLHARGTELEREYPLGVARQCLEPVLRREHDGERLLRGAARLAGPVVLDVPGTVEATPVGLLHGLYWLLASLADEAPLLVVVDDAHWADESSLRFLAYLARRVESLPIALLIGARNVGDVDAESTAALAQIRAEPGSRRSEPLPLGVEGVERLLRDRGPVDEAFARACHEATGGNPFLLGQLLEALRIDGVPFTAAGVPRVTEVTPPTVALAVGATLARLGPRARALARAVAVLGEGVPLELASELGEVPIRGAASVASELVRAGILDDEAVLRFRHPILTGAVRAGLAAHERAAAHARAAELLRARGSAPERVALQLLHTAPREDARVVGDLRFAAEHARERGAPTTAVVLLRRALSEPPEHSLRGHVLFELGRAELALGKATDAAAHLDEAQRSAVDPLTRGRALALLAQASAGDPVLRERVIDLVEATLPDVENCDRELALRLRALLVLEGQSDQETLPSGATLGEAVFLGHLVLARMRPDASAAEIADIAERAARQVEGVVEEGASSLAFLGMVLGMRWADRLDGAERLLDRAIASARRRGATTDFATAMTLRAEVRHRAGRLRDAEADARVALGAVLVHEWLFARSVAPLVGALLDQGRFEEAERELAAVLVGEEIPDIPALIPVLLARMRVRAARREHDQALADWEEAVRRSSRLGGVSASWIEDLTVVADIHHGLGDRPAAEGVVAQALKLSQRWGTPGAIGQALHAQARIGTPDESVEILRSAVDLLGRSPARLQEARARVALGGALRRQGHRVESRAPLREGYALARRCGADGLAETARAELRASGIRLRREAVTGADALTPSERRIAEMAAAGLSNAEIAQELFVTLKTIEMHLTHAYRKLDIRRRGELAQVLGSRT